jgi:hypothetical protein
MHPAESAAAIIFFIGFFALLRRVEEEDRSRIRKKTVQKQGRQFKSKDAKTKETKQKEKSTNRRYQTPFPFPHLTSKTSTRPTYPTKDYSPTPPYATPSQSPY